MKQKLQTIIYLPNLYVGLRIDDYLYQPHGSFIIKNITYENWTQEDVLDEEGWLVKPTNF